MRRELLQGDEQMNPDYYYECYPAEIVDKVIRENPGATMEQLHSLIQAEWDARKCNIRRPSMAELADAMGFPDKPARTSMAEIADDLGL